MNRRSFIKAMLAGFTVALTNAFSPGCAKRVEIPLDAMQADDRTRTIRELMDAGVFDVPMKASQFGFTGFKTEARRREIDG